MSAKHAIRSVTFSYVPQFWNVPIGDHPKFVVFFWPKRFFLSLSWRSESIKIPAKRNSFGPRKQIREKEIDRDSHPIRMLILFFIFLFPPSSLFLLPLFAPARPTPLPFPTFLTFSFSPPPRHFFQFYRFVFLCLVSVHHFSPSTPSTPTFLLTKVFFLSLSLSLSLSFSVCIVFFLPSSSFFCLLFLWCDATQRVKDGILILSRVSFG